MATPTPAVDPAPAPAPRSPRTSDATPAGPPHRAGAPSLRAPYAPGQRAPRGPRQATPTDERQPLGMEVTAAYEEFVVTTRSVETDDDRGSAPESSAADRADEFAPPTRTDRLPPALRHNGHAHDAGRRNGHTREREEHAYSPAHQSAGFDREDDRDDLEAESLAAEDREAPGALPRGDIRGEVGPLIDDLKALFQRDRATASTNGGTRCGICYLHYALDELEYRDDEGYYVCSACARSLGAAHLPMVRRQKRA